MCADAETSRARQSASNLHVLLVSNRFETDARAGGTEVLTADLAFALLNRSIRVTWLATTTEDTSTPAAPPATSAAVRRLAVDTPAGSTPPDRWHDREATVARAIASALSGVSPIDVIHVTHFSRTGLEFLYQKPVRTVAAAATLTDYTAICGDYQLINQLDKRRCKPPIAARTCSACLTVASRSPVSARDVATWRRRNLTVLNRRCQALWMQTPFQRRRMVAAGLRDDNIVSDRAAYAIPSTWRPHRPPARPTDSSFSGTRIGRKGPARTDRCLHGLATSCTTIGVHDAGRSSLRKASSPSGLV